MRGQGLDSGRSTSLCSRSDVTDFTIYVTDFTADPGKALDARSKARLGQEYVIMFNVQEMTLLTLQLTSRTLLLTQEKLWMHGQRLDSGRSTSLC